MNIEVEGFQDFMENHDSSVNPESFGKRGHGYRIIPETRRPWKESTRWA